MIEVFSSDHPDLCLSELNSQTLQDIKSLNTLTAMYSNQVMSLGLNERLRIICIDVIHMTRDVVVAIAEKGSQSNS